ncbi:MAG TPA: GspE/PulE family protein [Thermodesulfobacteriota bacterium]|nr:GspE/PulE family protein [Thermodesulfobacteriota bacterium]
MAVKKIGEILVESGLITSAQFEEALRESKEKKGVRLGSVLIKKGYASEVDIAQTLAFQLDIPFIDMSTATVDPEAVRLVSEKLAKKYRLIALYQDGKTLHVAMSDPLDLNAIDDIRFSLGLDVMPGAATPSDIDFAINRYYHMNQPIEELMVDMEHGGHVEVIHDREHSPDLSEQIKKSSAPPIIKMVDSIIAHGVESRASDIHLEPQENNMCLRLRVDGIMRETMQMPKWVQGPVVSRIKLMAGLDITERRVSQDGRIKVRLGPRKLDLRVSTLPTQYGETVVMRIFDPHSTVHDLRKAGLSREDLDTVTGLIDRPQGVTLVTGPTGSGKTSTLYAMLAHVKSPRINIVTIEDPVEFELKNVSQVSVNDKTGLSFSYVLRSVLRQDPDVILVGEMRDSETAIIALQASLTGHLVFSTLHTNDAVSTVTRLKNMGVPPYMIASALNGIVAQRLLRTICAHCKEEYTPSKAELEKAGGAWPGSTRLWRGKGCPSCKGTGYSGRTGIYEVLEINEHLRSRIASDAPEKELYREAARAGMVSLRADGLKKVAAGLTTLEELSRVIYLSKAGETEPPNCPACLKAVVPNAPKCLHCGYSLEKTCPTCGKKI